MAANSPDIFSWDEDLKPRDRLGRQVPHTLGALQIAKAVPGLVDQFDVTIPGQVWSLDADDSGGPLAIIACPCGHEPQVAVNGVTECECHRFFLFTGEAVRAANRPGQYAEQPVDPVA